MFMKHLPCIRKYAKCYYLPCFLIVLLSWCYQNYFLLRIQECFSYCDCLVEYENLKGSLCCITSVYRSGYRSLDRVSVFLWDTHWEPKSRTQALWWFLLHSLYTPTLSLVPVLFILHIMEWLTLPLRNFSGFFVVFSQRLRILTLPLIPLYFSPFSSCPVSYIAKISP